MRLKSQLELICMAVICQSVKQDGRKGIIIIDSPCQCQKFE